MLSILILGGNAHSKSGSLTESKVKDLQEELDGCKVKLNQAAEYISYQDGQISSLTEELEELQQRYRTFYFIPSNLTLFDSVIYSSFFIFFYTIYLFYNFIVVLQSFVPFCFILRHSTLPYSTLLCPTLLQINVVEASMVIATNRKVHQQMIPKPSERKWQNTKNEQMVIWFNYKMERSTYRPCGNSWRRSVRIFNFIS